MKNTLYKTATAMLSIILATCIAFSSYGKDNITHAIKGKVIDYDTRLGVDYANVVIKGTNLWALTDEQGNFTIENVSAGIYNLECSKMGYQMMVTPDYIVSTKDIYVSIEIRQDASLLDELVVYSPISSLGKDNLIGTRDISLQEIEISPGGNRDISKIVQQKPGVSFSPVGYRNDLIVRGGSPIENKFYIDGIEIPNINHFSTQGATGGPVGILNADLIRSAQLHTGSFPIFSSNALSSVMNIQLQNGNLEKTSLKASFGGSEFALTGSGHIKKKTTYITSLRLSYLQFLFDILKLPFLPRYFDTQMKVKHTFDPNNELSFILLTGQDNMKLNTDLTDEESQYILSYLPMLKQTTFTAGVVYKHYYNGNKLQAVLSGSLLSSENKKYIGNNSSSEQNLMYNFDNFENQIRIRVENESSFNNFTLNAGVNGEYVNYESISTQRVFTNNLQFNKYNTDLQLFNWGMFLLATYQSPDKRFSATAGARFDASSYSSKTSNPLKQFSPRISASYNVSPMVELNAGAGIYYQLPPYTALSYKENNILANTDLEYMRVVHSGIGVSVTPCENLVIAVDGFYKKYTDVPTSLTDSIPLLCKGNDYGIVGNEPLESTSKGDAYGVELMVKWEIPQKLFVTGAVTLYRSEFMDIRDPQKDIASAWDNKFILNLSGNYKFNRGWSAGARLKATAGAPYTPYDIDKSSLVQAWDSQGKPYLNYALYNILRLDGFYQIDIRIDKQFVFKKWILGLYLDIQNITNNKIDIADGILPTGEIANPNAPANEQKYVMKTIPLNSGTLMPTIGITFEI